MKKISKLIVTLVVLGMILVGCSGSGDKGKEEGNESGLKVAVVLSGTLGDKSFNDSSWEGVQRAKEELGFEVKILESTVPADWETNLIAVAQEDYDVVIAVSSMFQEIVARQAPNFPDKKFILIDAVVKEDNVASAIFAQNEGSFLAGAAAAMFTTKTDIENVNPDKTIGWVGGMDVPVLHDFLVGYEQGAAYIDPETKVLVSFAGTFTDPLKGKELTLAQYSQGADIVMNVASNTGNGILEAAKESGKYAIGVDLDQDGVYPGAILTSMLKRADEATYQLIMETLKEDKFPGGEITMMNVANGGVGLTEMKVMKEALGDKFPEDILEKIAEITEDIKSGKIVVESYEGFSVE